MKKTLAMILTLALVICMMPTSALVAYAANEYTVSVQGTYTYNGSSQTPTITVKEGNSEVTGYAVKYYGEKEQESNAVETAPTKAGTYNVLVSKTEGGNEKKGATQFVIGKYDLSKIRILIDNQTNNSLSTNPALALSSFEQGTVHYYSDGKPAETSDANFLASKIKATLSETAGLYTVQFSVEESEKDNFGGTIPPTNFQVVKSIADSTVKITDAKGDNITSISLGEYDGKNKNIENYFKMYDSSTQLYYRTHYTYSCPDTKNVGTKAVTIEGIGQYGGTRTISAVITPRSSSNVTCGSIPDQTVATMNDIDPIVKDNGLGITLKKGTDYFIESVSGTPGNKGTAIIKLGENYGNAQIPVSFNVVSNTNNVESMQIYYGNNNVTSGTLNVSASMFKGTSQPLANIAVYADSNAYALKRALSASYYDVKYECTDRTKTPNAAVSTTTPTDANTYDVYIVGKNGYAGKKKIGTYKIPQYDMKFVTVSVSMSSPTAVPTVTVKSSYENITFVKDRDYTMTYTTYTSTGKVYVTVKPTLYGNLTGSSNSDSYPIASKPISSCTVSFKDGRSSAAYTGSNITVNLIVKDGYYTTLTQGKEYKVTYKNAAGKVVSAIKDAGTYTIELTGQNGYTGTTYVTFTVTGTDIGNYTVTLKESKVNADGRSKTPVITSVAYGYASKLNTTDYTVSYQDSTGKEVKAYQMSAPGTYRVVVTGKNGYTGSCYANFTIEGLTQSITGVESSYKIYPTSEAFKLQAKATEGVITYTSSDPSVASVDAYGYVTPHKAGRAKITISTTGNVKYNPANDSTVIKVYPNKAKLTRKPWKTGNGKIKVRWNKQDNVTRYEVRYARNKSFKSGSYKTKKVNAAVNTYTTQSTTISGLRSGYTYYVKVRAVKEVYNDYGKKLTYYGNWSGWKTVRA